MAVKEAKDVQVYTGSQWKTLKDQQVYDGGSWRKFGVGSGVSNGSDWYVMGDGSGTEIPDPPKPPVPEIPTLKKNYITLARDSFFNEGHAMWVRKYEAWTNTNVESDVKIEYNIKYNPDGNLNSSSTTKTYTIYIPKGGRSGFVNTLIPSNNITVKLVSGTIKSPVGGKDEKYEYWINNSSGQSM